jgi:hypothetical protein
MQMKETNLQYLALEICSGISFYYENLPLNYKCDIYFAMACQWLTSGYQGYNDS